MRYRDSVRSWPNEKQYARKLIERRARRSLAGQMQLASQHRHCGVSKMDIQNRGVEWVILGGTKWNEVGMKNAVDVQIQTRSRLNMQAKRTLTLKSEVVI